MRCPDCTQELESIDRLLRLWKCSRCGIFQINTEQDMELMMEAANKNQHMTVKELLDKIQYDESKSFGV